jgi:hypothetical protein
MNPLILAPILEIGKTLIDRLFPDEQERAKAELELLRLTQENDIKLVLSQLEVNAKEAENPNLFVSGWRPAAGWAGVFGLVYTTVLHPFFTWGAAVKGWPIPPVIDTDLLWIVLTGMLGIGTMRSYEKVRGVAKK